MWQNVLQTGRKHCGKRRNCSLRAISPFPTVFSKYLSCRHVKTRACLGKGEMKTNMIEVSEKGLTLYQMKISYHSELKTFSRQQNGC